MTQLATIERKQLSDLNNSPGVRGLLKVHREQIEADLKHLGAVRYDMWLPETQSLPLIIHPDEKITGIIYGRYVQHEGEETIIGRGALVATGQRVLLIDKKPLFVRCEEIPYRIVSGVDYGRVGFVGNVTLNSRIGTVRFRTFNQQCAHNFVEAIERQIFQNLPASSESY